MNGLDNVNNDQFVHIADQSQQGMLIPEMMQVAVVYVNKLGRIIYRCLICSEQIGVEKSSLVELHLQDHLKKCPYNCHECSEQLDSLSQLIEHSNAHSSLELKLEPADADPLESIGTESDTEIPDINLDEDVEQISDEKEEPFENCAAEKLLEDSICTLDDYFVSSENEEAELDVKHPVKINKRKYSMKNRCKNKKDPTKRYPCDVCEKLFVSKANVKKHMRIHTDEKPYQCLVCDKRFRHSSYVNIHMRSHTREKPYMCTFCGSTFMFKSNLSDHMHGHSGTQDLKCDKCSKSFSKKDALRKHKRTHSDRRPFVCDICGACFRVGNALRQHLKLHSDVKEYKCKICDDAFSQPAGLHHHMKTRHNLLAPNTNIFKTQS